MRKGGESLLEAGVDRGKLIFPGRLVNASLSLGRRPVVQNHNIPYHHLGKKELDGGDLSHQIVQAVRPGPRGIFQDGLQGNEKPRFLG
ncbi:hypothetical protein [Thermus arciformis]|uniref:hypothetical protein n=1 Tax=Thermus arciformis TaxID=482827 RepID=UPI0015A2B1C6|nr:hypothetical protein [Thermus arciformis]